MLRRVALAAVLVAAACSPSGEVAVSPTPAAPAKTAGSAPLTASPPAPPTLVAAVKGDWGAGTSQQSLITQAMCSLREQEPYRDVITTGDNFYNPDGVATPQNYENPERCLNAYPQHRWRAVWGNHDLAGDSTLEVLGAERWYGWSEAGVEVFMLDSNDPSNPGQLRWLEESLTASGARVKIAVFHHSPYTTGSVHPPDARVRANFVPLFERHGVDLVLSGHQHLFEHSLVNGIHYLVSGGGGNVLYRCAREEVWLVKCLRLHHFLMLRISEGVIEVRVVDIAGEVVDRFEIRAGGP